MKKDKDQNSDIEPQTEGVPQQPGGGELDAAGRSLANALNAFVRGVVFRIRCQYGRA